MKQVNTRKFALWSAILLIIHMIIGNLLYMNPVVMGLFEQYQGHPSMKPMESMGGMGSWIAINASFSIIYTLLLITLYAVLYNSIPGKGLSKGLMYVCILIIVKALPEAFNQYMVLTYPTPLIAVQFVNAVIGLLIFGMLLSYTFKRFGVITE